MYIIPAELDNVKGKPPFRFPSFLLAYPSMLMRVSKGSLYRSGVMWGGSVCILNRDEDRQAGSSIYAKFCYYIAE